MSTSFIAKRLYSLVIVVLSEHNVIILVFANCKHL